MKGPKLSGRGRRRRPRRKVFVAPTGDGRGLGVFAAREIAAGEIVLVFTGPLLRLDELRDRDELEHSLQIGPELFLGPSGGEDDYVNHSCEPNAYIRGLRTLVALRPIARGEEITLDYSTCMDLPGWRMECLCGSPRCRGMIVSFFELPEAERARLAPLASGFLRRKIRKIIMRPCRPNLKGKDERACFPASFPVSFQGGVRWNSSGGPSPGPGRPSRGGSSSPAG